MAYPPGQAALPHKNIQPPKGSQKFSQGTRYLPLTYKTLLQAEYRFIKSIQEKIRKNTSTLYKLKTKGVKSALTRHCSDFLLLEKLCKEYTMQ